jgi:hypothetical protein
MTATEILERVHAVGGRLYLDARDLRLRYHGPAGSLSFALKGAIAANKQKLTRYLRLLALDAEPLAVDVYGLCESHPRLCSECAILIDYGQRCRDRKECAARLAGRCTWLVDEKEGYGACGKRSTGLAQLDGAPLCRRHQIGELNAFPHLLGADSLAQAFAAKHRRGRANVLASSTRGPRHDQAV